MRKRIAALLMICSTWTAWIDAQQFEWAVVQPVNITSNPAYLRVHVTVDSSGFPACARLFNYRTNYGLNYYGDVIVEKMTPSGASVFSDILYGKVSVDGLATDRHNNLIVYGRFRDTIRIDTALRIAMGAEHAFLIKLAPMGSMRWLKDMTAGSPSMEGISDMAVDQTNRYWITEQGFGLASTVRLLDDAGNVISTYVQDNVRIVSGVAVDEAGNVWAAGSTFNGTMTFNGTSVEAPHPYNLYVVKYRPNGSVAWVRFVEDITLQTPRIAVNAEGQTLISAQLWDAFLFGDSTSYGPEWVYDFFLAQLDSSGTFQWVREIPQGNSLGDGTIGNGRHVGIGPSEVAYVCGFQRNQINWGQGVISNSVGGHDALILGYSSTGVVLWARTAGGSSFYADRADAVIADRNGNLYVTGLVGPNAAFDSLFFSGGHVNAFLAKITFSPVVNVENPSPGRGVLLFPNYPNPFNPTTTIKYELTAAATVELAVYDVLGRKIQTLVKGRRERGTHLERWNGADERGRPLPSGVFFLRLKAGNETIIRKLTLLK